MCLGYMYERGYAIGYVYARPPEPVRLVRQKPDHFSRPFDMVMVVTCGNGRPMLHVIRSNCMISGSRTVPHRL